MTDEKTTAEPSGASGGSLANAHSDRQDAEAKIIVDGIAEIMRIASEPDWIPVTERLPEEGERVLFFVNRRSTSYAAVYAGKYLPVFGVWEYCQASEKGWAAAFVTHWMPLPAPPADGK